MLNPTLTKVKETFIYVILTKIRSLVEIETTLTYVDVKVTYVDVKVTYVNVKIALNFS